MGENISLSSAHVAILGLGLMGGSLALALRGKCGALIGYDPDHEVLELARHLELVDLLTDNLNKYIPDADFIILAAPIKAILTLIDRLPEYHPGSAVVVDIGSTKQEVLRSMEKLPEHYEVVGGHPMCGKEKSSILFAEADLYKNCTFILCPSKRTGERARKLAKEMVDCIGSQVLWMDAAKHDTLVAATSHFPCLLSNLMVTITPDEARPVIGPGFRSTARIASTSPDLMTDIIMTNRVNLIQQINRFQELLSDMKILIENADDELITKRLEEGVKIYQQLLE